MFLVWFTGMGDMLFLYKQHGQRQLSRQQQQKAPAMQSAIINQIHHSRSPFSSRAQSCSCHSIRDEPWPSTTRNLSCTSCLPLAEFSLRYGYEESSCFSLESATCCLNSPVWTRATVVGGSKRARIATQKRIDRKKRMLLICILVCMWKWCVV